MNTTSHYPDGSVSDLWDDVMRWYTAFDTSGKVTSMRPYNTTELAAAPPTQDEVARNSFVNAVKAATTLAQLQAALTAQSGYTVRVRK